MNRFSVKIDRDYSIIIIFVVENFKGLQRNEQIFQNIQAT